MDELYFIIDEKLSNVEKGKIKELMDAYKCADGRDVEASILDEMFELVEKMCEC